MAKENLLMGECHGWQVKLSPGSAGSATGPVCTGTAHPKVSDRTPPTLAMHEQPESPERGRRVDTKSGHPQPPLKHHLARHNEACPLTHTQRGALTPSSSQHPQTNAYVCFTPLTPPVATHTPAPHTRRPHAQGSPMHTPRPPTSTQVPPLVSP